MQPRKSVTLIDKRVAFVNEVFLKMTKEICRKKMTENLQQNDSYVCCQLNTQLSLYKWHKALNHLLTFWTLK